MPETGLTGNGTCSVTAEPDKGRPDDPFSPEHDRRGLRRRRPVVYRSAEPGDAVGLCERGNPGPFRRLRAFFAAALILASSPAALAADTVRDAFDALNAGDFETARAIAAPLADKGDADAQHLLGFLYETGQGAPKDIQHAVDLYVKAGQAGQADAQFALGELASRGEGVKRDAVVAAGWYRLAAAKGHARAKLRLGVMAATGAGTPVDKAAAAAFFTEAANAGEPEAQRNLAIAYMGGDGVRRDMKAAARWFAAAADAGDPVSNYNLGLLISAGEAPGDLDAAAGRMRAAADAGFPAAMTALGLLLHDGAAAEGDETPADWFERAAKADDPQGRFLYAVALVNGDGRAADLDGALYELEQLSRHADADPALVEQAKALRMDIRREIGKAGPRGE